MTRSLAAVVFALVVALTPFESRGAAPGAGSIETTAPVSSGGDIPEEIPLGNAADDPVTSRAVMQILKESARRYATVETFRATGTYIEATKIERGEKVQEKQSASSVEILFRRPDRLRISVTGEDVAAGFVADGKQVTFQWPKQKQYRQFPQPDSLAAFVEEERAGEILDDETNAIVYSLVGALLISEDPLRWIHANVESYVYDGVEEVRGRPAWRIKFLQSDPAIVVINWVDKETKLLSKVSIIQARDENGEFVESYADSTYGQIRIVVLDRMETGLPAPADREFAARIPKGWTVKKQEEAARPSRRESVSPWERLVRAAAATTGEKTSPTLTVESGGNLLRLSRMMERPSKVTGLAAAGDLVPGERALAAVSEKSLTFFRHDGEVIREAPIRGGTDLVMVADGEAGTSPVLVTASTYGAAVRGFGSDGRELWSYERPGRRIGSVTVARAPGETADSIYVGYLDGTGLRVLGSDGRLRFASRRLTGITALTAGEIPGTGWRVVASTGNSGGFFSPRGEFLSRMPDEEDSAVQVGLLALDDSQPSAPLLQVASVGGAEYVLRRARPDNSPVWTVPLAQEVKEAEPVGLVVARLRLPASGDGGTAATGADGADGGADGTRPFAVTLLSDGRVTVTSPEGRAVWRGKAVFGGAAVSGDLERVASALATADLDGDGEDELYVGGEGHVLQIVTGR